MVAIRGKAPICREIATLIKSGKGERVRRGFGDGNGRSNRP